MHLLRSIIMNLLLRVLAREFHVDKHSSLCIDLARACARKRRCYARGCKERLKLKRFLDWNLDTERVDSFDEQIEKIVRLWIDPRLEFYCCYHFEPYNQERNQIYAD